jgi:transposase
VALFLAVGWDLVKDIFKGHLKKRLRKRKWKKIRYIAVDEFAIRKRHQYMTVVLDLETGEIIHAQPGKDAAALTGFLMKLKRRKAKPLAVAMDMSPAYMQAVRQVFPDVDIVHDPYHVVALVNDAIDETRRDLSRQLSGQGKSVIKGSRFLLLMGLEKLRAPDWVRLQRLMDVNQPLFQAYLLKEVLREFWRLGSKIKGRAFLLGWIDQALGLGNPHFAKLAKTLARHMEGMLSYFRHPITTGPLEGLNNKIKVLKRQAYGFRDMEYFKLRLFFIHEDTPAFPG